MIAYYSAKYSDPERINVPPGKSCSPWSRRCANSDLTCLAGNSCCEPTTAPFNGYVERPHQSVNMVAGWLISRSSTSKLNTDRVINRRTQCIFCYSPETNVTPLQATRPVTESANAAADEPKKPPDDDPWTLESLAAAQATNPELATIFALMHVHISLPPSTEDIPVALAVTRTE